MLTLVTIVAARADVITLDSGASIDGDLAQYEYGGDCQIGVTGGGLAGAIVIVPCHRIQSFVRTTTRAPEPLVGVAFDDPPAVVEEELAASAPQRAPTPPRPAAPAPVVPDEPIIPTEPDEADGSSARRSVSF
jgi:hypothetical protein